MHADYVRIVNRFEFMQECQREAEEAGCILQHNTKAPYQFVIAPKLLDHFEPVRTGYNNPPPKEAA